MKIFLIDGSPTLTMVAVVVFGWVVALGLVLFYKGKCDATGTTCSECDDQEDVHAANHK